MITLYDHIQELRAELKCCHLSRREREWIQEEIAQALVHQSQLDREFDSALSFVIEEREAA